MPAWKDIKILKEKKKIKELPDNHSVLLKMYWNSAATEADPSSPD